MRVEDLEVYRKLFKLALEVHELTMTFLIFKPFLVVQSSSIELKQLAFFMVGDRPKPGYLFKIYGSICKIEPAIDKLVAGGNSCHHKITSQVLNLTTSSF